MDVTKAAAASPSWRNVLAVAVTGGSIAVALALPSLVLGWYGRLAATVLAGVALGSAGRLGAFLVPAIGARPTRPDPLEDPPTVTVLVTAYDEAHCLPETIEACRNLDYPSDALEVLLCYEGASSDGTSTIAERAAEDDSMIEAIEREQPPGGKAAATNRGLDHATGDIVAVIDADQVFEPDAVRRAAAWFRADDDIWCVKGRRYGRNPEASLIALHATVEHHLIERIEFVARDVLGGFTLFTGGQAFFRASVFDELERFDESVLLEDVEMASRLHARGKDIRVDPGIITTETNPETVSAWWHQRVRWARGGMQVGVRHLRSLLGHPNLPVRVKLDALATFGSLAAIPALVFASPAALASLLTAGPTTYLPGWWPHAVAAGAVGVPFLAVSTLYALDRRAGRRHAPRELLTPLTLWGYAAVQAVAITAAFLYEFVLSRPTVYVTS